MKAKLLACIVALLVLFAAPISALAQDTTPAAGSPVYIIQPGDSLWLIASWFNVKYDDLLAANNITDPNNISAGARLIIPGLDGINGVLDKDMIQFGDSFMSVIRRNQIPQTFLRKINHITSPSELYAGVRIIVLQPEGGKLSNRVTLQAGDTFLEAAIRENSDAWTLKEMNGLSGTWEALPGDVFYAPGPAATEDTQNGMPSAFINVDVENLPFIQGRTAKITIQTLPGVTLGGFLVDKPLHFFPLEDGKQIALQGIHAMLDTGAYPLRIEATLPDGSKQSYEQLVLVTTGYYPDDPLLLVEPETIDPLTTESELAQITAMTLPANPEKYWSGKFQYPAYRFPEGDCYTSRYGNRRIYLGAGTDQRYYSFHTGLDFCGGSGLPIYAPAAGKVIFAGPLTIRGNATVIDHGWGIYSGFWHQSELKVQVGQLVAPGELIGAVGGTGRVTGAHLHWEIWVNGVQVNPMEWLENSFP